MCEDYTGDRRVDDFSEMDAKEEEGGPDFRETDGGFILSMDVPRAFFGVLIGRGGETIRRIRKETRCQIEIPPTWDNSDVIVLRGLTKERILSAKTEIDELVDNARQRQKFTHFLSVPLNTPNMKENFTEFKEAVLRHCEETAGLDEVLFQNPDKLHLTITTLVLLTEQDKVKAQQLLEKCKADIVDPILAAEPCKVDIEGLECMNDDRSKARILYARIKPHDKSNKLQTIADSIMKRFRSSGLAKIDRFDRVNLHVTLMNCAFRKDDVTSPHRNKDSFDAQSIIQKFGDFKFGSHTIDCLHISQRGSYDESGFYSSVGQIHFPIKEDVTLV